MTDKPRNASAWLSFLALMAVLASAEVLCAHLAYDNLGEVMSAWLMGVIIVTNVVPMVCFSFRLRAAAVIVALLIALAIVPYQLVLATRLLALEHESSQLIAWAYSQRVKTGRFPADLERYHFHAPWLKEHFTDYHLSQEGRVFGFSFWVGTRGTSHSFGAGVDSGGWGYYAD